MNTFFKYWINQQTLFKVDYFCIFYTTTSEVLLTTVETIISYRTTAEHFGTSSARALPSERTSKSSACGASAT